MYIKPQVEDSMVWTDSSEGTQTKRCRIMTDSAEIIPRSPSNPQITMTQKISS